MPHMPIAYVQEQEDAIERERASAASRLREACERYETQLATQRARLGSDADMRLEQADVARREEKRRAKEEVEAAIAAGLEREAKLKEEWAR